MARKSSSLLEAARAADAVVRVAAAVVVVDAEEADGEEVAEEVARAAQVEEAGAKKVPVARRGAIT